MKKPAGSRVKYCFPAVFFLSSSRWKGPPSFLQDPAEFHSQVIREGSELFHTLLADVVSLVCHNVVHAVAENAGRLIFLQDNTVSVDKNLERILVVDVKCFAQFRRNDDTAKIVNGTDDSCGFHVWHIPFSVILSNCRASYHYNSSKWKSCQAVECKFFLTFS